jgi:hypothetical protein
MKTFSASVLLMVFALGSGVLAQVSPGADAASGGHVFTHLATYRGLGSVLVQLVGPGPRPHTERLYQTYVYDGGTFDLVSIDPDTGHVAVVTSPVADQIGAWGLAVGPDGNLYVGTLPNAHVLRFDPRTGHLTDLGRPSLTEEYIWELTVGSDRKLYGCTYPSAKLIRFDPTTGRSEDLGRMDAAELYARYLAASEDGFLYVGIGFAKARLVAYHIATGVHRNVLPLEYETGRVQFVRRHSDHKVYAQVGSQTFRLDAWTATEIPPAAVPPSTPTNQLSDARTVTVSSDSIRVTDPRTNRTRDYPFRYAGKESNVFRLGFGPDSLLYGSGYMPAHLFRLQPQSGTLAELGVFGTGEFFNLMQYGRTLVGAAYNGPEGAPLLIYDPSKPLAPGSQPQANPRFVHYPGEFPDWRPLAMIAGPHNKIYVGAVAAYGQLGGPLTVWDPSSHRVDTYPHLIRDQSVSSLTAMEDLIVGGTTVHGGGGSHETQTEAKLFLWDPVTKQTRFETVPVPGARSITDLVTARNGKVYGFADAHLFVFDVTARTLSVTDVQMPDLIFNSLAVGPEGLLWGLTKQRVFAIDPSSNRIVFETVAPEPITAGFALDATSLYYASGAKIYRYQRPHLSLKNQ